MQLIQTHYPSQEKRLLDEVLGIGTSPLLIFIKQHNDSCYSLLYYDKSLAAVSAQSTAIFILHHPEHGHAIVHPILSLIIDGTLVYDRNDPPFSSFISLVGQNSEVWNFEKMVHLKCQTYFILIFLSNSYGATEIEAINSCIYLTNFIN